MYCCFLFRKSFWISIVLFITIDAANAQLTAYRTDEEAMYRSATELFIKEKYSAAKSLFEQYLASGKGSPMNRTNAIYYSALCATELFHPDAEKMLMDFIESNPENIHSRYAYFQMGRIYYKQKNYSKAIDWFEKADAPALKNEDIAEYYFKLGYSYYSRKEYDKASQSFRQILNIESRYQTAANYYYGHVAYSNNNYATALSAFEKLNDSETFGPLIPYYVTQIYFEQGKYDELISYAVPKVEDGKTTNVVEIKRLIAESFYKKGNYRQALKYFDEYRSGFPQPSREDYYQTGFCHYKLENTEQAVAFFEKTVNAKDYLAQNAYYMLGDCFIKMNNKQSARSSFQFASQMDFDKAIKEDALFNYAKLSYELNFQPVAINAFRDYTKSYPNSAKADEANELLAQVYLTTRNYKDALAVLENIPSKNERARAAYQKVAYYRAIEFFNDGDKEKAIGLFTKAIVTSSDPNIQAMAMYWKAESFYALNKLDDAVKQYRIFIFNPKSLNLRLYNTAHYGLAYAHFKLENYSEAATWFRKYIRNKNETDTTRYNDALVRIGDCLFMQRDYVNAQEFYSNAIGTGSSASDYCLFQKAMMQGITGNIEAKAATLVQLISKYPKSAFADDAVYERGTAFLALNKANDAEEQFNRILNSYKESNYVKKAKLSLALIYFNRKEDEKALGVYKQVIRDYPSTAEAAEALNGVKNIYVNSGNPNAYFEYLKTVPFASISAGAQDSITYEAAEQRYMKGETESARKDFSAYLQRFPQGAFALNAAFYKAECDYRARNFPDALTGYESIIALPRNVFTEKSLLKAAQINFINKNFDKSLDQYIKLEETADFKDNQIAAQAGQMRCNFILGKFNASAIEAQKVMMQEKAPAELQQEARLIYAKSLMETKELIQALGEFKTLAKLTSSETGAEARYYIAFILNQQGNFKESQKKCLEVANQVPSYDYWVAKSFILLADNYLAQRDTFQAKHTLKSIMDNYEKSPGDAEDIVAAATQRFEIILQAERSRELKELPDRQKLIRQDADTTDDN